MSTKLLPPAMPWVKLYTCLLDDHRFSHLDDQQKCRYFQLLMLVAKLDTGGYFVENGNDLTVEDIAWKLRLDAKMLKGDMAALVASDLARQNGKGWYLPSFEDEQGPKQIEKRKAWKKRQRSHRAKLVTGDKLSVTGDKLSVTGDKLSVTLLESEKSKRRVREEEKKINDLAASPGGTGNKKAAVSPPAPPVLVSVDNNKIKTSVGQGPKGQNRAGQPVQIGVVLSRSSIVSKPVVVSGYTNFQNPASAVTRFGMVADERDAERVYCRTTSMPTFPPSIRAQAVEIIQSIMSARQLDVEAAVSYFRPIFEEYITRKNKTTHQPYKKTGLGWLEIALEGQGIQQTVTTLSKCPPDCPSCGGLQVVRSDVPPEHELFGKMIPCPNRKPVKEAAHV